jgi:hypothetical protein
MSEQDIMDIPVNSYRKLKQELLSEWRLPAF